MSIMYVYISMSFIYRLLYISSILTVDDPGVAQKGFEIVDVEVGDAEVVG